MNLHDRDLTRAAKREGIAEGILQGAAGAKFEAARNLYANGISQEIISKSLDLPLSKVSEILGQTTEKAIEAAVIAVKDFNITPQLAAEKMNAPLDAVLETLSNAQS